MAVEKEVKDLCARKVGGRMIEEGVAIWNGEHLVAGPSIQVLMNQIEESKVMTGRILSPCHKKDFQSNTC